MPAAASVDRSVVLQTLDLSRAVDGKVLLDSISISVARGETLAILGASGSGKSTLLRLLNRLDEPTQGTVLLDGIDYTTIPPGELRRRVGMVMQQTFLFPGTVADNVAYGPRARGKQVSHDQIGELLTRVNLRGYESRNVSGLSGGEAQRVAIARTLMNEPEVLLLDEPTSALDRVAQRDVEALLIDLMRQHTLTCLLVTHDPAQAIRLAERVVVLERGQVRFVGPVEELHNHAG